MSSSEEQAWVHGAILADALRQQLRKPGSLLPIGAEASLQFFDLKPADSARQPITSCQTCRIRKEGPGRIFIKEDGREYRIRYRGCAFDVILDLLAVGFTARGRPFNATDLKTTAGALYKSKRRVIDRLRREGAVNTADYLSDAIRVTKSGAVSLHNLKNSGRLIFG